MKVNEYEYTISDEYAEVSEERKNELISLMQMEIEKNKIALHQILDIGEYDEEYDFMYKWLKENNIQIIGIDVSISGEIENYTHIPKLKQGYNKVPKEIVPKEKLKEVFKKIKNGDEEARQDFIVKNIRLAKWVSRFSEINKLHIPEEDKTQIAMLGLIRAVDKFNPDLGYAFSSFAVPTIYRKIISEWYKIEPGTILKNEKIEEIKELEEHYLKEYNRMPTNSEIIEKLEISESTLKELQNLRNLREEESLDEKLDSSQNKESMISKLDETSREINEEGNFIENGVYVDEDDIDFEILSTQSNQPVNTELEAVRQVELDDIEEILNNNLTEKQKKVIKNRTGLEDGTVHTLENLAKQYGVNKETIRQIEIKSIKSLRRKAKKEFKEIGEEYDYKFIEDLKSINQTVEKDESEPEIKETSEKEETRDLLQELKDTNEELLSLTVEIDKEEKKKEQAEEYQKGEEQEK